MIVLVIILLFGVGAFAFYYFSSSNKGNTPPGITPTAGIGGGPTPTLGPAGPCSTNSPYGFTTINADAGLVSAYKQLNVCWVRYQYHWDKIETSPGVYNWSAVDSAIQTMTNAGIHVDFAIQSAPSFRQTVDCYGSPFLPGPNEMATFATILASRYDGRHGHGKIDSFEIGNEEYDNHFVGSEAASEPCRSALVYGPILKAGYQAIKAVYPGATVGMFGQWLHKIDHIRTFFTDLFTHGYGQYMDYMNFHFYNSDGDPSTSNGQVPSFDEWWQTMHQIASANGFANLPIWVTEVGWATTPTLHESAPISTQLQAQYVQYILTQSMQSKVIQKVFWFTINYANQGDSLAPQSRGPLPSYYSYAQFVRQNPTW